MKKTTIKHIHESIIIRILCYLPADSVIRCRSVCKNWATLIFSQYFAESYSLSSTRPLHFLLNGTVGHVPKNHKHWFLADLDHASCNASSDSALPVLTKSVLPDFESYSNRLKLCSICNLTGFIVAYVNPGDRDEFGHPYHIFNPITSLHIVVQQNIKNEASRICALLLAHKTNRLKLLRVFSELGRVCGVEIQTIGTDSWRTLRNSTNLSSVNQKFGFPCYLNGIYHWTLIRGKLVCFNPDEEVFHCITPPLCIKINYITYLGILDGCLAFIRRSRNDLEFWVMKEYGVPESWIKNFVIPNDGKIRDLSDTVRFLNYGEKVVLCDDYNDFNIICYNPSTGNCKFITYYVRSRGTFWYVPAPFVPNFRRFVYG